MLQWDAFTNGEFDVTGISGAEEITLEFLKTGFRDATVTNTGVNNITAGSGYTGTLTVQDATTTVVEGGAAGEVIVDGTATAVMATVNAGANTGTMAIGGTTGFQAVEVTGSEGTNEITVENTVATTIDAGAATTLTIDGTGGADTAAITLDADATATVGKTAVIEEVLINAADGVTATLGTGSDIDELTVASDGAVTLVVTDGTTTLNGNAVTNEADDLTVQVDHDGDHDLENVQADLFVLTATDANALTFADNANVALDEGDLLGTAVTVFTGQDVDTGVLNLTVMDDQGGNIKVATLKTLNLTVEAGEDVTLNGTEAALDINFFSEDNVTITTLDAENFNAGEATGNLTIGGNSNKLESIVGSQGENDITLDDFTNEMSVVTFDSDDTVTFNTKDVDTNDLTLVLGGGNNTVDFSGQDVDGQTVTVITEDGNDDVQDVDLNDADSIFIFESDGGDNTIEIAGLTNNAQTAAITTGDGDDTLTLDATTFGDTTFSWTAGAGTDTLELAAGKDLILGTIELDGVTHILDTGGDSEINGTLLHNEEYYLMSGVADNYLIVDVVNTPGTYDFSKLELDNTFANKVKGLQIQNVENATVNYNITGTYGDDKIDVSTSDAGTHTLEGGLGADEYILESGAGASTVVISEGDTGITATTVDQVTDFDTTTDKLKLGVAGTATNYDETGDADYDTGSGNAAGLFAAAKVVADGILDGTVKYSFVFNTNAGETADDTFLFIDYDMDGTSDAAIQLLGLNAFTNASMFELGDIIA